MYKHGNQAMYRIGLVQRIGEEQVVNLERIAVNEMVKKWTRPELYELINTYKNGKSD
jgi:hypothetical protein